MANQLLLPGPDPLQARRHKSFYEFFGDNELDPSKGDYTRIMARFDPEVNQATSHVMLLELAVGSGPVPQAYLCCSERRNQTRIFCIHMPSRFVGSLDGQATPWDGSNFAYLGELTQGVVTTINLPNTAFRTIANVHARTSDYIVTHLDELTEHGLHPPPAGDEDVNQITTRMMMYLPPKYAGLFLNPAGYSLRQAWELLYPAIVENNDLIVCAPLLKWLRVVTTGVVAPQDAQHVSSTPAVMELTVPIMDGTLIAHRNHIIKQVLPGAFLPQDSLELAITQMAAAVTQNTTDNRQAREAKAAKSSEPKLPSQKFAGTITILQEYLQIADETQLPPLWHKWANCNKREEFNVLANQLQLYARSGDAFSSCHPIASAKLVQDLQGFVFLGESTDDIKTGLQPFIIADGSAEHRQANLELARTYGLLNSGENTVLLSDLETLKSRETQSIPLTYFELERNLGMFGNLLGTVLGTNHILTSKYREFWDMLSQGYRMELQQIIDNRRYIKPAHLLRSIQLHCYNWFYQRRARLRPATPDFTTTLHNIVLNTFVLPHLPPVLYKLAYPKVSPGSATPSLAGSSVSQDSTPSSSVSGASNASSAASITSAISGLTMPTMGDGRQRGSHFANVNPDNRLVQLVPPGIKLRDLMGSDHPPALDNGQQMCLSFLLRGGCWSTCRRATSHTHSLNDNERNRLIAYLQTQRQKLQPAPTPGAGASPTPN
jgi:hypothetical protein